MTNDHPPLIIFGADGLLGRQLVSLAAATGYPYRGYPRQAVDVTDPLAVVAAMDGLEVGVVVNAAAYTAVDQAESEPDRAYFVNRDGAGIVARSAANCGLPVIHLSTDYVFDGIRGKPYEEGSDPHPLSVYGSSKLAGELAVLDGNPQTVILRTSWLFGPGRPCFPRTILRLAREREELRVIDDQMGCPTPASGLAQIILNLAPQIVNRRADRGIFGPLHCCGDEPITWYGFAAAILAEAKKAGMAIPRLVPVSTPEYPLPARRPAYSVLSCHRLRQSFRLTPPSWRSALAVDVPLLLED